MKGTVLKGMQVCTRDEIIPNGYIKMQDGHILAAGRAEELAGEEFEVVELPSHYVVIPGCIDVHIHGVKGADTMDGTKEALQTMAAALPREGTTSFLATTMTQERSIIEQALRNAGDFAAAQPPGGCAELLGVHLEGPFINAKMAGAQPVQHILDPDVALLQAWNELANGGIRLVTLAPERPNGMALIRYLKEHGIVASLGHTDATYKEVDEAIAAGASHVTHLYNQMRGMHHREPGTVGAAVLREELQAEMIVDGVHVCPEMVQLAFRQKRSGGLLLITDAMRAKCLADGRYDLGGQAVTVADGRAVLADGTLAGSTLRMGEALRNMLAFTGCTLQEAVEMAAVNPAKQLGVWERKGSIAPGKDADLVVLDENLEVCMTFCRGVLAFARE